MLVSKSKLEAKLESRAGGRVGPREGGVQERGMISITNPRSNIRPLYRVMVQSCRNVSDVNVSNVKRALMDQGMHTGPKAASVKRVHTYININQFLCL